MTALDRADMVPVSEALDEGAGTSIWADKFRRRRLLLGLVVVFLVSLILGLTDASSEYISPWDEGYHLSYVQYMSEGHVPRQGEAMGSWSREAFSCHPVYPYGSVTAIPCGEIGPANAYPEGGGNTAAFWPPGYYFFAALWAKAMGWTGLEPLALVRSFSVVIWAFGCAAMAGAAVALGALTLRSVSVGLVVAALPLAAFHGSFVSPHATQPLITALLVMAWANMARAIPRHRRLVPISLWLGAVTMMAMTIPHMVAILVVLAAASGVRFLLRAEGSATVMITTVVGAVWAAGLFTLWGVIQSIREVDPPADVDQAGMSSLQDPAFSWTITPFAHWWDYFPNSIFQYPFLSTPEIFLGQAWAFATVLAFGAIFVSTRRTRVVWQLMLGVVFAAPLVATAFQLYFAFEVPIRYGMSIGIASVMAIAFPHVGRVGDLLVITASGSSAVASLFMHPFPQ